MKYEVRPDEEVSAAVVEAVSAYEDRGLPSLPPLADVIDPDALDALFAPTDGSESARHGKVQFTTNGYEVEVTSTGRVHLTPQAVEAQ
jgi:hypothetical protein